MNLGEQMTEAAQGRVSQGREETRKTMREEFLSFLEVKDEFFRTCKKRALDAVMGGYSSFSVSSMITHDGEEALYVYQGPTGQEKIKENIQEWAIEHGLISDVFDVPLNESDEYYITFKPLAITEEGLKQRDGSTIKARPATRPDIR